MKKERIIVGAAILACVSIWGVVLVLFLGDEEMDVPDLGVFYADEFKSAESTPTTITTTETLTPIVAEPREPNRTIPIEEEVTEDTTPPIDADLAVDQDELFYKEDGNWLIDEQILEEVGFNRRDIETIFGETNISIDDVLALLDVSEE
ncbi:hypothetical protein FLK61_35990 [Paenalkalicoccus suaedae]|uniref:Uncharacterized protein n=1 Tax=Paenalkalicoccus suaedae TaxID=2592382 RepID=A0A859FIL3_9BACI|nr:hypothetical protein [Paenalkalicoccus suaedae]QKS72065.1 hypothetical protein FLK61_35990 [Paenalkalicoccus suaedae]